MLIYVKPAFRQFTLDFTVQENVEHLKGKEKGIWVQDNTFHASLMPGIPFLLSFQTPATKARKCWVTTKA